MQEQSFLQKDFSLDSLIADLPQQPEEEKPKDPNEPQYIIYSQQIDTKTIKRTRNLLTPAVCNVCGLDLVKLAHSQNKVSTTKYSELRPDIQKILSEGVILHKQKQHSTAESLIVGESDLPKRWLTTEG